MRALESQVIQQQNGQPRKVKILSYQNGQDAGKSQTPGFNEDGGVSKKRALVSTDEIHVNSDEAGRA